MTDAWKTLAERLGIDLHDDGGRLLDDGHQLCNKDTQDLLIGMALRVAWDGYKEWYLSIEGHAEIRRLAEKVWQESDQGESRAVAALELLDAVGYTND